jgi:hypothetical protein
VGVPIDAVLYKGGIGCVPFDASDRSIVLLVISHFSQRHSGGSFGVAGVLSESGLRPLVFFVMRVAFMVELKGVLNVLDGRFRAGMLGRGVSVDGDIVFAPVNEVLPEAGVFQFFTELFWLHQIALKFLHNLKHLLTINAPSANLDPIYIIFPKRCTFLIILTSKRQ